jgi:site-specific DNA-methyltransferase (adenine-specific)
MEAVILKPTEIKVKEGLDRFRGEMGNIKELAKSITEYRQILPIIITRDKHLIDGGRRLAACMLANTTVKCVYEDVVDDAEMRELEFEANLHRKDFTPAERAEAITNLHKMKQERLGKAKPGIKQGHSVEDTAKLLGMSKTVVLEEFQIAEMIKAFPELKQAKNKQQIKKAAKSLLKLAECSKSLAVNEEVMKQTNTKSEIEQIDAIEHMKKQPDGSIDILLTDPLYGIDADKLGITSGGITGGMSARGYKIKDEKDYALFYYVALATESFRFCTHKAHGYVFLAPEHFDKVRSYFMEAGWRAHIKPLIWIKNQTGQCNVPTAWPSSCYEMVLYIRKDNSKLVLEGQPDWLQCNPVSSKEKVHDYEKPVALLENFIKRSAYPGQLLYDPFMGSGASIIAALNCRLRAKGCDNSYEAYTTALNRIAAIERDK